MKPLVVFADPEATVRALLVAGFSGRSEPYVPLLPSVGEPDRGISTTFPKVVLTDNLTHLQVELENADDSDFPVLERAQVRVTAYVAPGKRSNAKDLASLAHGLLLATTDIHPQVGRSDVSTDPDTKNLMCWFLVRVTTRATQLAS